ncbi:hypothetical protein DH2020_015898 [Rehmannia glutinosa]|uniref:Zinc-finger domain-containing protein n=1 Tax=Rehmannia glutinosa TaxID=99300 RepID=A0ABR0WUG7_REHGL
MAALLAGKKNSDKLWRPILHEMFKFQTAMAVEPSGGIVSASSPVKLDKSPESVLSVNGFMIQLTGKLVIRSICLKWFHFFLTYKFNFLKCRQKTMDFAAACKNQRNNKPCSIKLCRRCLLNRYGEKAEEVAASQEWSCPKCRGICNCSVCMKRKGHQPTGILINTAKATGFSSVSEMLLRGAEHLNHEREVVFSPRKRGKENSFDGKLDSNLPESVDKNSNKNKSVLNGLVDDNTSSKRIDQGPDKEKQSRKSKPKKMKRDRLGELSNGKNVKENMRKTSVDGNEKKPKKSRRDGLEENDDSNEKDLTLAGSTSPTKLEVYNEMSNQGAKVFSGVDFEENVNCTVTVTKKDLVGTVENDKQKEEGGNSAKVKNFLKPQVADFHADIPLPVGTELTSVAELISSVLRAADYETLNASEKLRILNLLCDEVLGTKKVRNWIDDQNTKLAHKIKEAKQKVLAAKDKEKSLKQKMKDDIAKAIIAKDGGTLLISEQEAVVSVLNLSCSFTIFLRILFLLVRCLISPASFSGNQTSDAVRVERIYIGHGGHAYWKLNCCGKSDVLHQDVGKGDTLTLNEKWFALDVEGKEAIEKRETKDCGGPCLLPVMNEICFKGRYAVKDLLWPLSL